MSDLQTNKDKSLEWHERLYKSDSKNKQCRSPSPQQTLKVISETSKSNSGCKSPNLNEKERKISYKDLKVESQRAPKGMRKKISVVSDHINNLMFSKNSGTPNQRYSKDLSPINNTQFDFSSALNEDFIKRGKSNELEKTMLSVIDSSISKEVPPDSQGENMANLAVPKERKFSFMAHMAPPEQKEVQKSMFKKGKVYYD